MSDDVATAHWNNFIYRQHARHWHALWCRWTPAGDLKQRFYAERIFTPIAQGASMRIVYHYDDERGTVVEGPTCGPWELTEELNRSDGMAHPSSPDSMTTLLLPGGPSAWCMKACASGSPCAVEMFLHHEETRRVSVGVIHGADGMLQQLSLIRETTQGPWPHDDWSSSEVATRTNASELQELLKAAGMPTEPSAGTGFGITARLEQSTIADVQWESTRVASIAPSDVALLCSNGTCVIVAPEKRVDGQAWCSAAAWWPKASDSEKLVLYTMEALWDAQGILEGIRCLSFA